MKSIASLFFALLFLTGGLMAQVTAKPLKKVMTLDMPGETGSNGAAVVWHPVQKKYYVSFAGNATYPSAVFDAKGKRVSPEDQVTEFDVRGMWYNPVSKRIEANGYDDAGWIFYALDPAGLPQAAMPLQEGQVQPGPQSVGVFDDARKKICFLDKGLVYSYSLKGEVSEEVIPLKSTGKNSQTADGELEASDDPFASYNATALCYTGIPNAEFAVLNYIEMQIELYDRKGKLTKAFKVPGDVPLYNNFNFAFANGTWWLFDKDERKWLGFR